jgi:hypothetical protein
VAADGSSATDEDTLKKAMRRKAIQNLDGASTSPLARSYLSFSTPDISSKLSSVGMKLGNNLAEINLSTNVLRHMEFDRLKVSPKIHDVVDDTDLDEEEANATMDG